MHCYTMGPAELPPYLEAGFYISFSGVVTYPKNDDNRAAAQGMWAGPRVALVNGMTQASAALFELPFAPVEGREFHEAD